MPSCLQLPVTHSAHDNLRAWEEDVQLAWDSSIVAGVQEHETEEEVEGFTWEKLLGDKLRDGCDCKVIFPG